MLFLKWTQADPDGLTGSGGKVKFIFGGQGRNSEPVPRPASVRWSAWLGRMALGAVATPDGGELLCWQDGHGIQVYVPDVIALSTKDVERLRDTGRVQLQADRGCRLNGERRLANGSGLTGWPLEQDAKAKVLGIALAEALLDSLDGIAEGTCLDVDVGQDDAVEAGAYPP